MGIFLAVLLVLSLIVAVTLLLSLLPAYRARFRTPAMVRMLGAWQLIVGALWAVFGLTILSDRGTRGPGGWYALVLGGAWCVQALRRLAGRAGRGRSGR